MSEFNKTPSYIFQKTPNSIFYFRIAIPKDIQPSLTKIIQISASKTQIRRAPTIAVLNNLQNALTVLISITQVPELDLKRLMPLLHSLHFLSHFITICIIIAHWRTGHLQSLKHSKTLSCYQKNGLHRLNKQLLNLLTKLSMNFGRQNKGLL